MALVALAVSCQGERERPPFKADPPPAVYVPPAEPKDAGTTAAAADAGNADGAAAAAGNDEFRYLDHLLGDDQYPCTGHEMCSWPSPADGTLYTVGGGAEFIDPGMLSETEGFLMVENLFEGLVKKDMGGKPVPGVAERWELSDDGLVWTFHLRKNAKWTNGRTVTAHDFVYSYLRKMSAELASPSAEHLYQYIAGGEAWFKQTLKDPSKVGVRAIDDFTFEIRLERPTPFFMLYLKTAHYYPVPKEAVEKHGKQWTRPENIVSNGAYKLAERVHRGDSVLVKNETYWNAKNVRIPKVHIYFSDQESQARQRYLDKQIQWFRVPVQPDTSDKLMASKSPDLIIDPYACYYYYGMRNDKKPFDNKLVRRAFNMAIDKERLTKHVTRQLQIPARGAVPPFVANMSRYPLPKGDEYNPEKARQLLAEAGYPNGSGLPPIELQFNTFDFHRKVAEFVQRQLKENINVKVTLNNMEWKSLLKKLRVGDYQISRFGWCGNADPFSFLKPFTQPSANNYAGYKNDAYDKLVLGSLSERNHDKRMAMLAEAEKMLQRDMPVAPLYYYTRPFLKWPVLRGFKAELGNTHLFEYMYWGDKEYD